eukprot:CAMPEP_0172527976 /NCGR_PEP_ID=MMETSP1067-20121228/2508_1 /TAXON_ID=265564 ORGANISM="Thalassiosira punctigera, Strain Tpunct2005C2" /NCGR_SAMPLE_ID=MMETSP1067 /ASSEMBLY_ACC=CAM_ASM_000444 /LENGTH=186 /DNA_ID=CAMNT_0013311813 /DNA_START=117 /DNA_END=678 /DNA_ORIENTATION=-
MGINTQSSSCSGRAFDLGAATIGSFGEKSASIPDNSMESRARRYHTPHSSEEARHSNIDSSRVAAAEVVDLLTGIICTAAPSAVSRFHVLHGVGTGSESGVSTNGTGDIAGSMSLHVHVQLILSVELAVTLSAFERRGRGRVDTVRTARIPVTFGPLVTAEFDPVAPIITICTVSPPHPVISKYIK